MRRGSFAGTFVVAILVLMTITASGRAVATGPGGWEHVGHGATASAPALDGPVDALNTNDPGMLFVGGGFTSAGSVAGTDRIARWTGSAWHAVTSPSSQLTNGQVNAIAYDSSTGKLYVGGTFINAGGNADADFVAVSDGTSWAPVCDGSVPLVTATVSALQIIGRTLYVGGSFTDGGGIASADRLVACDLDTGIPSTTVIHAAFNGVGIYALAADSNGTLYAGGAFTDLEGTAAADNVAYLDGTGWHAMGAGGGTCGCAVPDIVRSLVAVGTDVYIGTDAQNVAGIAQADDVAKWNGSAWSAMGSRAGGADGWFPASTSINAMTSDGTNVYATGNFSNANGDPRADEIARFDGAAWHSVGSDGAGNGPLNARGFAAAIYGGRLHVGGNFTAAGGDTQAHFLGAYPGYHPACSAISLHGATGGALVTIQLECSDQNGDAIHKAITSGPSHGKVGPVSASGKVTYTPAVGYTGTDKFSYEGHSSDGLSDTAAVSINVTHPGFANAGRNVTLKLGTFAPSAAARLSFQAHNRNTFALHAVSASVSSVAKVKGEPGKTVTFAKSSIAVKVGAGKTTTIALHLTAAKLALLKHLGHVRVLVSVTFTGPQGSHTTATLKGTLRAPK
jgi:Bacterial Ig domain